MSKTITRTCDKCRRIITDDPGSILEAKFGAVTKAVDEPWIDLCPECSAGFLDWLKAGQPALPELQPIEPATDISGA